MIDGLWTVHYYGPQGNGAGIVVLLKGQIYGGDNGFFYIGSYEEKGDSFKGKVSIKNFDALIPNVIGVVGDFELLLEGTIQGETIKGTGALTVAPDAKIVVNLLKRSNIA
jgi:T3SS negative regulator,GrlR